MLLYLIVCNVLFIPIIYGGNSTLPKVEHNFNKTDITVKESQKEKYNKTKVTLISEGGSIVTDAPLIPLPKENRTVLGSLENEIGNEKTKSKSVVPRKGVVYDSSQETAVSENSKDIAQTSPIANKTAKGNSHKELNHTTVTNTVIKENNSTSVSDKSNHTQKTLPQQIHKKPLLLSYEALSNTGKEVNNDQLKIPAIVSSSSKTLVSDQMQSPNKESGLNVKVHSASVSRHPGMIMPVVITILVVPMFAVLGYMALKRGQEAWKNRHYKRMDFLLDGMYND